MSTPCPISKYATGTILSNTILSVYHFAHTILSVLFCPLPFCPVTPITAIRRLGMHAVYEQSPLLSVVDRNKLRNLEEERVKYDLTLTSVRQKSRELRMLLFKRRPG